MNRNCNPLFIEDYQDLIDLYSEFQINKANKSLNVEQKTTILTKLHDYLCSELENNSPLKMYCEESSNYEELRAKVRALLTVRAPLPLPEWFNGDFDKILQNELLNRDLVDTSKLPTIADQFAITEFKDKEKCVLWRGDISLLQVDAIVNAANSAMLGCFIPFHKCIDNIIHSRSGPRLRDDCSTIIKKQDCFEEVGWAKITRAYNLPSIYVIHTYGPDLSHLKSIAFCGISTGVFAFPNKLAAKIAIRTVEDWIDANPERFDLIVFDVYAEKDYTIYKDLFENWSH
ncbi:MAG: macro domain-containing protein [Candidatus Heimdallarchaeota archaeon]